MVKHVNIAAAVAVAALLGSASPAFAWGPDGHQAVGALADQLLAGSRAAKQVKTILGGNLQTASVWADCVKGVQASGTRFSYQGAGHYPECKPFETNLEKQRAVDYVQRNWSNCHSSPGQEACHKQYHYTDIALQHDHYAKGWVGTSDHDVVSAIQAAIAVLRGHKAQAPIQIKDQREALRLLAHLVGDVHQPLHVAAVYLAADGQTVNPDAGTFDTATETRGGNELNAGHGNLHHEWDTVPASLHASALVASGLADAKAVPATPGQVGEWPIAWASDTVAQGRAAFQGLQYGTLDTAKHQWPVTEPANYSATRESLQRSQMIKAGARLAALLRAVWP